MMNYWSIIQCNDPGNTQELIIERKKDKALKEFSSPCAYQVTIRGKWSSQNKSLGLQGYRDLCYSLGRLFVAVSRLCGSFQVESVTLLSTGSFLRELQKHKTCDIERNQARPLKNSFM